MSDDAFAPPTAPIGADGVDPRQIPSAIRGIAITALVLGGLSGITMLFGAATVFTQPFWIEGVIEAQPAMIREEYRDLVYAQASWRWLSIGQALLGVAVCGAMIVGGIQAITGRGLAGLALGAASALGFDVFVAFVTPLLSVGLVYDEWVAFTEAAAAVPGASGGMVGALVGIGFNVVFYFALAGFWFWAYRRIAAARAEQPGL